jgi:hypothetical protein
MLDRSGRLRELGVRLLGDAAEEAVDESPGVLGGQRLGQLDGFVDGYGIGHVVTPQELEQRDPEHVPVDDGHAIELPAVGMGRYQGIDVRLMRLDALDQNAGSSSDLGRELLATLVLEAATHPSLSSARLEGFHGQPVPDLRFVEDV